MMKESGRGHRGMETGSRKRGSPGEWDPEAKETSQRRPPKAPAYSLSKAVAKFQRP